MKYPNSPALAALFTLAKPYDKWPGKGLDWIAMPKLNGIRAMWVNGVGFVSRDGIPYTTGVLPHLEAALKDCTVMLDGELYCHGLSLQEINARAGVIREKPHAEHARIEFHVFDSPSIVGGAEARMPKQFSDGPVRAVPYRLAKCSDTADAIHQVNLANGYEGTVYKHPGHYVSGRTSHLLKRKGWQDAEFKVMCFLKGAEGKYATSLGAIRCWLPDMSDTFDVGAFAFPDEERDRLWQEACVRDVRDYTRADFATVTGLRAKVKFLSLSDNNKPQNSQCLLIEKL